MQIAILSKNNKNNILNSLVPMFGDSFFTAKIVKRDGKLFLVAFSSPCLGILFSPEKTARYNNGLTCQVFVPMFGDPFFTVGTELTIGEVDLMFSSPCLGILFSQHLKRTLKHITTLFSSPCLGILFSPY